MSGKVIPSTNSPIQLMEPKIRKADGLDDWLKISTMIVIVVPAEKGKQNTNWVYFSSTVPQCILLLPNILTVAVVKNSKQAE